MHTLDAQAILHATEKVIRAATVETDIFVAAYWITLPDYARQMVLPLVEHSEFVRCLTVVGLEGVEVD